MTRRSPLIKILDHAENDALGRVAAGVFDDPVDLARTEEFLSDPRHHIAVALEDGVVVGFASAVHYVHPDKSAPELWINELGVAPACRGRGLARALLGSLLQLGRDLGCAEAWVLADRTNPLALRVYESAGGVAAPQDQVMFTFRLQP